MVGFAIQPPVAEFFPAATYLSSDISLPMCTPSSVLPLAQYTIAYQYESTNTTSRYYEPCTTTSCVAIRMDAQHDDDSDDGDDDDYDKTNGHNDNDGNDDNVDHDDCCASILMATQGVVVHGS